MDHLVGLGHRSLAHVAGLDRPCSSSAAGGRAFEHACATRGVACRVIETDSSAREGGEATRRLIFDPATRPTAITYSNDRMALAGIGVAQRWGLSVPRDLSIAAFDESDIASYVYPSLTSVVTDAEEWGALAARTLLAAIAGIELGDTALAPARLVARESTAVGPGAHHGLDSSSLAGQPGRMVRMRRMPRPPRKGKIMRRTIKIAALVGAGVLMLTACSGGGGGGGDGGGDLEARGDITIWYSNNEAEIAWGKQMVEAWNADHPDEQIKAQEIPAGNSSEERHRRRDHGGQCAVPDLQHLARGCAAVREGGRPRVAVELRGRRRLHRGAQRRQRGAVRVGRRRVLPDAVEVQPRHDLLQQGHVHRRRGSTRRRPRCRRTTSSSTRPAR